MFQLKMLLLFLHFIRMIWYSCKIRGKAFKTSSLLSWINVCPKALKKYVRLREKWIIGRCFFFVIVTSTTVSAGNSI